ncbi:MAG: hypothetical protein AAGP08_16770, partial [Pseudomonadota bacterium]
LIPLHAFSLLMIGLGCARTKVWVGACAVGLAMMIVATWMPGVPAPRKTLADRNTPSIEMIRETLSASRASAKPIFSIHPAYPLVLGETAFLLDGFNLETFIRSWHPVSDDLRARIEDQAFSLVLLDADDQFGGPFKARYESVGRLGRMIIMAPKSE